MTGMVSPTTNLSQAPAALEYYEQDKAAFTKLLRSWGLGYRLSCDMEGTQPCKGRVAHYVEDQTIDLPPQFRETFRFPNPYSGAYMRGDLFDAAGMLKLLRGVQ